MTHDEAKGQIEALFEQHHGAVQRPELRAHLTGCDACRAFYDQTAMAMRRMLGRPEEMSPEELFLFEPPLPAAKVVPLVRPGPAFGLALAAMLAGVVVYFAAPKDAGFQPRTGDVPKEAPGLRALCLRGEQVSESCAAGDKLLFAAHPSGRTHVALFVDGKFQGIGPISNPAADGPLPWTVTWQQGMTVTAVFAGAALDLESAAKCLAGQCADGMQAVSVSP